MNDAKAIAAVAALRTSLGIGVLLAPRQTARLFGFPDEQQTAMTRLLGRWFGVRELVLAAMALDGTVVSGRSADDPAAGAGSSRVASTARRRSACRRGGRSVRRGERLTT